MAKKEPLFIKNCFPHPSNSNWGEDVKKAPIPLAKKDKAKPKIGKCPHINECLSADKTLTIDCENIDNREDYWCFSKLLPKLKGRIRKGQTKINGNKKRS